MLNGHDAMWTLPFRATEQREVSDGARTFVPFDWNKNGSEGCGRPTGDRRQNTEVCGMSLQWDVVRTRSGEKERRKVQHCLSIDAPSHHNDNSLHEVRPWLPTQLVSVQTTAFPLPAGARPAPTIAPAAGGQAR